MAVDKEQLWEFTKKILQKVPRFYSPEAVKLMMLVSAVESDGGYCLKQIGGPALSFWGVEPKTMIDNYNNHLHFPKNKSLAKEIGDACGVYGPNVDALYYNMAYALFHARLKFWRSSKPMPDTIDEMAKWHEKWYNTKNNYAGTSDWKVAVAKYNHFAKLIK